MKTIKNIKWSLLIVPVISVFSFVTIITAAPTMITGKMDNQEIETIAVVPAEAAKNVSAPQPTPSPQVVASATSTPAPAKPASTPAKKVQPQPSRSTSTSSTPKKSTPTQTTTTTAATQPVSKASAVIATGKKYIGVKYVYGGTTPAGFDCSGFTQYVFAKHGINLPRVSRDQFKVGTSVSFNNLRSGDLVFFSLAKNGVVDHVGIYVGNGQFINASSSKGVTIYTLGTYWKSAYVGAKRVL